MNTELFIRRPVMTTLVMAGILIFGLVAYRHLPVSDLPAVDYPTISVSASLPGASPETMASSVATPLEKEFSTIPGIEVMTSTSTQGGTSISLQFALSRNIDAAAQDVQAAISQAQRQLPQDMLPPSFRKVDPSASPILYYALRTTTLPLQQLNEYAETFLAQRLSTVDGVAQVQVYGSMKYAVRIQLDPQQLAARSIGIDEVADAVENGNVNLPTGILWGTDKAYSVESQGQLTDAKAFRSLVVAYRDGAPGPAGRPGPGGRQRAGHQAGELVQRRSAPSCSPSSGSRAPTPWPWPSGSRRRWPSLRSQIPPSVEIATLNDRSVTVKASVDDVKFTLFLALCLVVMVIFLFLRNIRATLIPALALPMSLIGTFAVMHLLGYSLDNLSLMALTLAVGFVVDDAIVVLENIVRHIEKGEPVFEAAIKGTREISFTVISMTLSLVAVFIPVLFLGGLIGRLFQAFAVTIGVAILVSGFVSLTLTPMLCSRWLKPTDAAGEHHGRFYRVTERAWVGSLAWYERTLDWVMDRRGLALAFSGVDPGRHGGARPHRAEGLHPQRGPAAALGHHRDRGGHQLRRDGEAPARRGGHRAGRPQRRRLHVVGGRGRADQHGQPGPADHPSEAARRARHERGRGGPLALAEARRGAGDAGVHPEPAGAQHRRPLLQERIPVHPHQLRHRRALRRRGDAGAAAAARSTGWPTSPAISRSRTRRCRSRSTATGRRRSAST